MQDMTVCENLSFKYKNTKVLQYKKGVIAGLLGKSGVGKSTIINILIGFLHPHSKCSGCHSYSILPFIRTKIGLLYKSFIQYDFMSIEQIERYCSAYYDKQDKNLSHLWHNRKEKI